jgi:lauroyl/myristoyl acyltransferase
MSGPAPAATASARPKAGRGRRHRLADRLTAWLVIAAGTLTCWLPAWPLWHLAGLAGAISYRVSPSRRDRARRNLRRVVGWMAAGGVGEERYRRAASDSRALESLVRAAFKQHAYYYVELARARRMSDRYFDEHVVVETPDAVAAAFAGERPLILVGLHFGTVELAGFYAAHRLGRIVTAMETIDNPHVQGYLTRTRRTLGLRLLTLEEAGPEMLASLRRGESVGLVADRELTGGGIEVRLFGAPTRIPAGPVLLASQSGAPVYVAAVRRTGPGRYRGNLRPLAVPGGTSRRERTRAMAQAEAELFEQIIVDAPEQWLAVFHPIWPDLEQAGPDKTEEPSGRR